MIWKQIFLCCLMLLCKEFSLVGAQMTLRSDNVCVYSFYVPQDNLSNKCQQGVTGGSELESSSLKVTVKTLQDQNVAIMQQVASLMQQVAAMVETDKVNRQQIASLMQQRNTECSSTQIHDSSKTPQLPDNGFTVPYINQTVTSSGGVHYVRWGRNVCPAQSKILYKGYSAGSHYTHTGGGSDYLCLPEEPQWGRHFNGLQASSRIYGTEYEYDAVGSPFSNENNGGQSLHDNNAPCVVCHVTTRSTMIMIPARIECPAGWTKEYNGYLASSHYTQSRNSYVCLDEAPEAVPGGLASTDGALFYMVEVQCGTLPCPRYKDEWEVTCVVCTM